MITNFPVTVACSDVIFILGPSCSGKSTTMRHLCRKLDKRWVVVELDKILIRRKVRNKRGKCEYDESRAIDYLIEEIHFQTSLDKNIVVDTNLYDERLIQSIPESNRIFCILIYASLTTLIKRDEKRTRFFNRDEEKKRVAKGYVLSSFARFYKFKNECEDTQKIGVIKKEDVDYSWTEALWEDTAPETKEFYDRLVSMDCAELGLVSKVPYDLCLNTDEMSILDGVTKICDLMKIGIQIMKNI